MTLLWAEKELEVDAYCIGEDHPDYGIERDTIIQLREAAKGLRPFDLSTIKWFDASDNSPEGSCAVM
jgi:hypothetical protein